MWRKYRLNLKLCKINSQNQRKIEKKFLKKSFLKKNLWPVSKKFKEQKIECYVFV